ncbi:hypothetical protein GO491_06630 [Flavobacteriaceae bacterium Ap0902]|nr:hypothetical protein [Flavobacteriaceae bacterium Ap0902]
MIAYSALIVRINQYVGTTGWCSAIGRFLLALKDELNVRSFDSSLIATETTLKLGQKVRLEDSKLVYIDCNN